jgi:CBS domain-containing protein
MNVEQLMMRDVVSCKPETDLAAVALMMWENDCGSVPITDDEGHPVGMVTDRDISIAGATRSCPLSEIQAATVKDGEVVCVHPQQNVNEALGLMSSAQVRRLPVVDDDNRLVGILSMSDIVACLPDSGAGPARGANDLSREQVIETMKSIMVHH